MFALCGAAILAQEAPPLGIMRGELVSMLPLSDGYGSMEVKSGVALYRCYYDSSSFAEREGIRVQPTGLKSGERLEVVTDRKAGRCYARMIRVMDRKPSVPARPRAGQTPFEYSFPRGNVTFSGVILRRNAMMLVLRTRAEAEQIVLLRNDTHFLQSGHPSEPSRLAINTRVFVRCSLNFENDLEAHQIIWGEIEGPRSGLSP
ncbi:MAG: hypothetical protein WKF37_07560 [Bryobacteraceae bacterium]